MGVAESETITDGIVNEPVRPDSEYAAAIWVDFPNQSSSSPLSPTCPSVFSPVVYLPEALT